MDVEMQMLLLERSGVTGRPGLLLLFNKEGGVYTDKEWTEREAQKEGLATAPWYD